MKQVKSCISKPLDRLDRSSKRFDSGAVMKLDKKLLNRHRALEKLRKHIVLSTFHVHFQQVDRFCCEAARRPIHSAFLYVTDQSGMSQHSLRITGFRTSKPFDQFLTLAAATDPVGAGQ